MERGHLDGESEEIVDEGVKELVDHSLAWHVRNTLQLVVDVQTGDHHEEAVGVNAADEGSDDE